MCGGFIIRWILWDLKYFLYFLVFRAIGVQQGKVHRGVQWVDQPDLGHLYDFVSEVLICISLNFALTLLFFDWLGVPHVVT